MYPDIGEILVAIKALGELFATLASRRKREEPPLPPPVNLYLIGDVPTNLESEASETALLSEVKEIWGLLFIASDSELEGLLLRTKQLLLKHPGCAEIVQLQLRIVRAIATSKGLRIFTYIQLMLWLFVLILWLFVLIIVRGLLSPRRLSRELMTKMQRPEIERSRAAAF
jgi:hypothetical protein